MSAKIKTALIASGNGTDAEVIMKAYRNGVIANAEIAVLISTKENVGCLSRAKEYDVPAHIIAYSRYKNSPRAFDRLIIELLQDFEARLVFLVGCIHRIQVSGGFDMYNIHPADTQKHGGQGMYGLDVHRHVMAEVQDLIARGKKTAKDKFFTTPTIHRVIEEYDKGEALLTVNVRIPQEMIERLMQMKIDIMAAAQMLQTHVLPYEWLMLPMAVDIAAQQILNNVW